MNPKAKRFMTVGQYFFWFLAVPLVAMIALTHYMGDRFQDYPMWLQIPLVIIVVPILINLFLGPSIYSFWKRKKSRAWITAINIILLFGGGFPGLFLWIWAWRSAVEPYEPKREGPPPLPG